MTDVLEAHGLFGSLDTDRGSHYWHTPEAGGTGDKVNLTQFGRALGTHQGRLPKELAAAGITDMEAAHAYIRDVYLPAFNTEFAHPSREDGSAFVPGPPAVVLDDILCEQGQRTVGKDNGVRVDGLGLQLPADRHRSHDIRTTVNGCRHTDGTLSVFHGPRRLARYDGQGQRVQDDLPTAA